MKEDTVNKPKHYQGKNGVQAVTIIDMAADNFDLPWRLTHALKYLLRYKEKGGAESLRKAIWYIESTIEKEYGIKKEEPLKSYTKSEEKHAFRLAKCTLTNKLFLLLGSSAEIDSVIKYSKGASSFYKYLSVVDLSSGKYEEIITKGLILLDTWVKKGDYVKVKYFDEFVDCKVISFDFSDEYFLKVKYTTNNDALVDVIVNVNVTEIDWDSFLN